MTRVTWGYTRLSADLGQVGLEAQATDVSNYARDKGWAIAPERMISETVPAYRRGKTPERPGFLRLLAAAEAEPESFRLVTYNLDRLVRDLEDWVRLRRVADRGAEVHAVTGNLDLSTGAGRMHASVTTSFKEFEIEELTRRIRANKAYRKSQGAFLGNGRRTFGYSDSTAHRTIIPEEADTLREVLDRVEAGESWRSIADELNRREIRTANGATWTGRNLSKTFISPAIFGEMTYIEDAGHRTVRAPWEPIFYDEDRERISRLRAEKRTYRGSNALKHMCSGLLICGKCDTQKRMASAGPRKYLCKNCLNAIHKTYTEQLLEKFCLLRLRDWQPQDETPLQAADITAEEEELQTIQDLATRGLISRSMLTVGVREIQDRIQEKQRRAKTRARQIPAWMKDRQTLVETWDNLNASKKREVMSFVFASVTVLPFDQAGYGQFQPERIQIRYR